MSGAGPQIAYAKSRGLSIAYSVAGEGPLELGSIGCGVGHLMDGAVASAIAIDVRPRHERVHQVGSRGAEGSGSSQGVVRHVAQQEDPHGGEQQRTALARNVKTPLVYINVLVRDWQAWVRLKVADIVAPMSFW